MYGSGTWALPGGHLEHMERADECLIRELWEEMGIMLEPTQLTLLAISDDLQPENDIHYVHVTFSVDIADKEPELREPGACEEWRWFSLDAMPKNIFPPHIKIFETIKSKKIYKIRESSA